MRCTTAVLSLALAGPLLFVAAGTATADTTQTSSCTDGGGHVWNARSVWSGKTYKEADGSVRAVNDSVSFTTSASDTDTVDYTVITYDGSGQVVKKIAKSDVSFDFNGGSSYYKVDPRNPPTDPGKAKILLSVGDGNDGHSDCTMTFYQPGGASAGDPTSPPASTTTCSPGDEVVKFDGQGSAGLAQYGQGDYNASAELWNVGGYHYVQTMGVCTHDAWYLDVTTDNSRGDGAVKAYPSMRKIYWDYGASDGNLPQVSSFPRLDVTFGAIDPVTCPGCIYDTAFDVWLNGIGNGQANELMIWTHNVGQFPSGSKVASGIKLGGHTWDLWTANNNHYLAFLPTDTSNVASGTFDLKDFTAYLVAQDKIAGSSKLGQISYGVETVSTNNVARRWNFTNFSVVDS